MAAATITDSDAQTPAAIPIIDTHIHLFDPTRPQGVPWPDKNNAILYKPALPDRYRQLTAPFPIRGVIEVECSPWVEDNQWVLDIAARDKLIVGTVGNLDPGDPEFAKQLERFHRDPLFKGIRYGNIWNRNLSDELSKPKFIDGLKLLAQAGLSLDTANPDLTLIEAAVNATDKVPGLRMVIDHLPQLNPPASKNDHDRYLAAIQELGKRSQVFVKISQVLRRENGRVPLDPAFYRDRINLIWNHFGDDRVLYGSDWPNSDQSGDYAAVLNVVREFCKAKPISAAEKYFWKNSVAAYRWTRRDPSQPA